jgi:hypothetical protein
MNMNSPRWHPLPMSSLVDALFADEEIEDIVALSGSMTPEWLQHLHIPKNWQVVRFPEASDERAARAAVTGSRGNGEWDAADSIGAFGYTGWLVFDDVLRNADTVMHSLDATDVAVKMLPVPPIRWVAAVRTNGTANIDGRNVWVQQSNYVAGSELPGAGRLIVHNLVVDSVVRDGLAEEISQLSSDVYQGFITSLSSGHQVR